MSATIEYGEFSYDVGLCFSDESGSFFFKAGIIPVMTVVTLRGKLGLAGETGRITFDRTAALVSAIGRADWGTDDRGWSCLGPVAAG